MEAASRDLIANCPESRDPVPGADFSTPLSAPPPSSSFIYHLVRRSSSRPFPLQPAHYELLTISISCASRVATVIVANKTRAIAPRSRIVMQTCLSSLVLASLTSRRMLNQVFILVSLVAVSSLGDQTRFSLRNPRRRSLFTLISYYGRKKVCKRGALAERWPS